MTLCMLYHAPRLGSGRRDLEGDACFRCPPPDASRNLGCDTVFAGAADELPLILSVIMLALPALNPFAFSFAIAACTARSDCSFAASYLATDPLYIALRDSTRVGFFSSPPGGVGSLGGSGILRKRLTPG